MGIFKNIKKIFFPPVTQRVDRFAREPWLYHRQATKKERMEQAERESTWCACGNCSFGEDVYISSGATVNPKHLVIGARSSVGSEAQIGIDVEIGEDCTINSGAVVRGKIRFGNGVRVATGAQILGFNHGIDDLTIPIYKQPQLRRGVELGDDVWVGANAVIVDGLTVGSHSVIGAGSIVTKNIPSWTVVAGNPASVIKSRMYGRVVDSSHTDISKRWTMFSEMVVEQIPQVLERSWVNKMYVDHPDAQPKTRPWADAVELAAMTNYTIPHFSHTQLINTLQSFQEPVSGLVPGPYSEDKLFKGKAKIDRMECRHSAYMVMAVGYALECLGSSLKYPVRVARDMNTSLLTAHLDKLPWKKNAWSSGAWIDHFASACYFNVRHHMLHRDMSDLRDWLEDNVDPVSGLWGSPNKPDDWSLPVNGFYRLTRGAHAQWNWNLPHPEKVIDTVLAHAHDQRYFSENKATACMVLDMVHPLWLSLKQTDYRRSESEAVAQYWLDQTISHWRRKEGMSFELRADAVPRLQGTEMWLSIAWICADLLGIASDKYHYRPMGVHRPDPMEEEA